MRRGVVNKICLLSLLAATPACTAFLGKKGDRGHKPPAGAGSGSGDALASGSGSGAGTGTGTGTESKPANPTAPAPVLPTGPRLSEDQLNTAWNVSDYAQLCKQELGLATDKVLAPWNCLDGVEIPITVDAVAPDAAAYAKMAQSHGGCDKPSWLGEEPCSNYAFVQKRELSQDVTAMLLCRMRGFVSPLDKKARQANYEKDPSFENFRLLYDFDSLGLIWSNAKTGKTCFFDYVGKVYGGYVPSPEDPKEPSFAELPSPKPPEKLPFGSDVEQVWKKNGKDTWKAPREVVEKDNCVRCHDTGPFKSSPWLDQVVKIPPADQSVPYLIVGKVFAPWHDRFPLVSVSTTKVTAPDGSEEEQVCTSCHRIGALATCESHLLYSTGKTAPVSLSAHGKKFFTRAWMPPLDEARKEAWAGKTDAELQALWDGAWDHHLRKLKCCCDKPNAKGCLRQDLTQSPLAAAVPGTGPEECK